MSLLIYLFFIFLSNKYLLKAFLDLASWVLEERDISVYE